MPATGENSLNVQEYLTISYLTSITFHITKHSESMVNNDYIEIVKLINSEKNNLLRSLSAKATYYVIPTI